MKIFIDPETDTPYFPLDQILQIGELRNVYKHFGIHGLNYLILFGWNGSAYKGESNEALRDTSVMAEVYSNTYYDIHKDKWFDGKKDTKKSKDMYNNHLIKAGIAAINMYVKVPEYEQWDNYEQQLIKLRKEADKLNSTEKVTTTPKAIKENQDALKSVYANIKFLQTEQSDVLKRIKSVMKAVKIASLNDFIKQYEED